MHWFKKHLWNIGIASVNILLLLTCLTLIPLSTANAQETTREAAAPNVVMVQATPTEDATVTALNKAQLTQQVTGQQHTWGNWLWSNAATLLSSFLSTLVIVIGALLGLWRWRRERRDAQDKELKERRDAQDKELKERRDAQDKELKERQNELEKRAEERFQAAVRGLGDDKEGARVGAAILLRTFLRSGYEQFYTQTFDLAVVHLRLRSCNPDAAEPLDTLSQALITVFKESFPLARDQLKKETVQFRPQSLVGRYIQLDNAYLHGADLEEMWMPQASLRDLHLAETNLSGANLSGANLSGANLSFANLSGVDLSKANLAIANLSFANLSGVDLRQANLMRASLKNVDLRNADLAIANLSGADLSGADLRTAFFIGADLSGADLSLADLSEAILCRTNLEGADLFVVRLNGADLSQAILEGANLMHADLTGADLSETQLEKALSIKKTILHGVKGLTKEQLEACQAKGAIIDDDFTITVSQPIVVPSVSLQNNDAQTPLASSTQCSTSSSDIDSSSIAPSSPQDPKS